MNPGSNEESVNSGDTPTALDLHRRFLQEVLAEVMPIFSTGERSTERLVHALEMYWEACFARRALRKKVETLALESQSIELVEPLGRPFFHMIFSELWMLGASSQRNALAATIYNESRAVAVSEANFDKRLPSLREKIVQRIRGVSLAAA